MDFWRNKSPEYRKYFKLVWKKYFISKLITKSQDEFVNFEIYSASSELLSAE